MTRKHFTAIAAGLAELKEAACQEDDNGRLVWWGACEAMAATCKQFNSNFDSYRFLVACGWESDDARKMSARI